MRDFHQAVGLLSATLLCAVLSGAVQGQDIAVTHCQGTCPVYDSPVATAQGRIVIHHLYAAALNGETGLADWVAYRLTPEAIGVASLLPRSWQADRLVRFSPLEDVIEVGDSELRLSEVARDSASPYAGANATVVEPENRARLAPMTSFANTPYWPDLNNLSNMVPMPSPLRLGAWLQLEQSLNRVVSADRELYVIAGPLHLISTLSVNLGSSNFSPAAYYKVVSDGNGTVAFMFPEHMGQFESFCAFPIPYQELEDMVSLNFFPGRNKRQDSAELLTALGCENQ
ncbi:MAG: DNA/RNA non-specific endonuclease [Gammaproteobacteria bacterium]